MKIINLHVENIKRLLVVDISPDDCLVQIKGKNGQGKTSVLDSIWWALDGAKNIQKMPINNNADKALIKLNLGEIIVIRTFEKTEDKKGFTTKLKITTPDGKNYPGGGQSMLDELLTSITFDPLEFSRMKPEEQSKILKKFVPEIDFESIDRQDKEDYEERRDINREYKSELSKSYGIKHDEECAEEYVEIQDLSEKIKNANEHNSTIKIRKNNRNNYRIKIENNKKEAERLLKEAEEIQKKLDNVGELPELINIDELNSKLTEAININKRIDDFENKKKHAINAMKLQNKSNEITKRMEERHINKNNILKKAKFPVKNITLEDGNVLLNEIPFEQASSSEKTKASLAIAMANNPKLRVVFIRDGSLLDEDSEEIVRKMAKENNFQIWQEKVESEGSFGFYIEDGKSIKGLEEHAENENF